MLFQGLLGRVSALTLYTPEADRKKYSFRSEDTCRFNYQVNISDHKDEDDIHNYKNPHN